MADFSPDNLLDILELIERISVQTSPISKEEFLSDHDIQDATAYRILAIGEACRSLPDDLKERHSHIPWRQITAMRNILAHEYFIREGEIIWETVKSGLPQLAKVCADELVRLNSGDK